MVRFLQAKLTCVVALGFKEASSPEWFMALAVKQSASVCSSLSLVRILTLHVDVYHARWSSYYEGNSRSDRRKKNKKKRKLTSKILEVAVM
jgi:hypothetical protein